MSTETSGKGSSELVKAETKPDETKPGKQLWKKGQSGNPAGRPKGAKGKLTLLRQTVKDNVETELLEDFHLVVAATLALAKEGDPTCLKIVWDRIMPAKRAIEEVTGKEDKLNINITIEGMDIKSIGGEVVDAEYEELPQIGILADDDHGKE